MKKVAVVILNWNGKKFLSDFLPMVIEHSSPMAEIIVADNASSDDSVTFMQTHFPNIRLILNAENGGFSKGYNEALAQVDADYFVLLNSDIEVTKGWIEPIIRLMEADDQIAACQPKIRSYCDREKFEYAGASGGFIDRFGYPFCRGRMFNTLETDHGQYDDTCEVFWATGAALFVRADLYKKYGGLDEDFFAHMEEIDFCWRMKNAGYKIMCCPESTVFHIGGGTLPKSSARKTYLNFRNNLFLLYKNLPQKELFFVFFLRFFMDLVAILKFALHSWPEAKAVFKAYCDFFKHFHIMKEKRKKITHQNQLTKIYTPSIVWDYYLLKKQKFSDLNNTDFCS